MQTFNLPDVGEGLTEAEIVQWHVKPGDTVAVNDVLCEIETAKSLVELPSPFAGVVGELLVAEGTTVDVGSPIVTVSDPASESASPAPASGSAPAAAAADEGGGSVLVGYGSGGHAKSRRSVAPKHVASPTIHTPLSGRALAKPPVRWLARELGVALASVRPTGESGEVTREDVVRASQPAAAPAPARQAAPQAATVIPTPAPDAREEIIPVRGVRKATATAMAQSAYTAPHVTVWKEVDATRTMELVQRLKKSPDFEGVRISPLLIMARALIWAAKRTPSVNATWTEGPEGASIVLHKYVNLGIAAATPRGLIVPNIKDAQELSMRQLAEALQDLTLTAREGRTTPAAQQGGTMTITNIGVFGIDGGTPILNPGESAIIAMGSITKKPWVVDGEVHSRFVTTVAGSFDHRVADGDAMAKFVADVASILEEPALLVD